MYPSAILSVLFALGLLGHISGTNYDEQEEGSGHSMKTQSKGNLQEELGNKNMVKSINCPPGWDWYGQHCYKVFGDISVNHANAQIQCQSNGANLLSIESQPENEFFLKLLNNAVDDNNLQSNLDIWLGATRARNKSPFIWFSKSKLIFTYWDESHPSQNRNDLCLQAVKQNFDWSKFQYSYAWQAKPCNRKNAYVCEMDEPAPINGEWSEWTASHCSASCGDGTQVLTRTCNNPVPEYGGQDCTGNKTSFKDCKLKECPIDGKWSDWVYSPCNATCDDVREKYRGQGVREMSRVCNNPAPLHGGDFCQGISKSTQECVIKCPIDGEWTDWKASSKCSKKCGEGYQVFTRTCTNPAPQHGGSNCTGDSNNTETCNNGECQMEIITDVVKQIPEFLLPCKKNPWIINCDETKYNYFMMIGQSGHFIEESSTGTELLSTKAAVEKSLVTSNDWATMLKNPSYLFKLSYHLESETYFLRTASEKYVVVQGKTSPKLQLLDSYKTSMSAMWKLWKIDGKFLAMESLESNGYFLVVQDGKATLSRKREFMTGINTQFISGFSLDRSKNVITPEGVQETAYGDILLHYFTPNGEDKTGYICDYDWDLPDAEAMCRYLGFQSGMPTFDGQYSSNKYPDYIISGVECEEGTESFMKCPFKLEYSNRKYFAQSAMVQFEGKGYGCNRGSKTDVAGVICGNQYAIQSLLVKDMTCEKIDNATRMSAKAYKFQEHFKMVTNIISENRHWSEFLMPLPMSISLTSTLLLVSSQYDDDVIIATPTAPEAFWKHLWGESLQSNLLYLANFISDTIEKSTNKMDLITYNSMEIQKYVEKVLINAFSNDDYEYKKLVKRQLRYVSRLVDDNLEKSIQIFSSFEKTGFVIKDLLFSLKIDKGQKDNLKEITKYLNLLKMQWSTLTIFFQQFESLLKIKQRNFKTMNEIYNDIYELKGSKPRKTFLKNLQESNMHTMSYTFFAERISRFYRKFSEDVLTQTNLNLFYLNMQKVENVETLARYKTGIIEEATSIQKRMSVEAGKEDSLMHDKIGSKLFSITNKLQCLFDKKVEIGVL